MTVSVDKEKRLKMFKEGKDEDNPHKFTLYLRLGGVLYRAPVFLEVGKTGKEYYTGFLREENE